MEDSREAEDTDNENADTDETEAGSSSSNKPSTSQSTTRIMRNKAEKQRRDKLNTYISELATLVPMVARSPKRMDKTSILRLTATYLRMNRTLHSGEKEKVQLPKFLETSFLSQTVLEDMDAFLLIVTTTGKIVFVTHTVEKMLGHSQNDLLGQLLYNITCPEDHDLLRKNLTPDPDPSAPSTSSVGQVSNAVDDGSSDDSTCSSGPSCPSPRAMIPVSCRGPPPPLELQKRSFHIRLSQRAVSRSEAVNYELVHVHGHLRIPQHSKETESSSASRKNDTILVAVAKLYKESRIAELSLLEANRDEYITRHLIDGRFIYSDHRISVVSGYLPEEVSGLSAFKFMHKDDFMFVITALRQMYDKYQEGEGYGSSVYRLLSKTGEYIYMRTHGYVEYSKSTHQVESFICVNTLISPEEGKVGLKEMRARYSASVKSAAKNAILPATSTTASSSTTNVTEDKSVDDNAEELTPLKRGSELDVIELAISKLIHNFPPPSPACEEKQDILNPPPDSQFEKVVQCSKSMPPSHIQAAQAGIRPQNSMEQKKTPQRSPSLDSNQSASLVSRSQMERPSVITERPSIIFSVNPAARVPVRESVFKRTSSVTDDDNERIRTSKRPYRLQPEIPAEESHVQYEQPRLSPEQQHRVIMTRDGMNSPDIYQDTTVLHLNKPLPLMSEGMFPMQNSPLNVAPESPGNFGMDNREISHFQSQSVNSPTDDPFRPFIPGMENNSTELVDILSTDPAFLFDVPEENLYVDTGSSCLDTNLIQIPLEQEFPTGQQVQLTLVEQQVTKCHNQLQSRMHQQGSQINSIVQDLQQVPRGKQVFGANLTQLRAEHRRQEEILHSIQEEHHRNSSCKEKLKVCTVKHNVGV